MKEASGEKAPIASISRSHVDLSDNCKDCRSIACAFTFSTSSGVTIRSTRLSPYGVIRCDTVLNLLFLRFKLDHNLDQPGPEPPRQVLVFLRLLVGLIEQVSLR